MTPPWPSIRSRSPSCFGIDLVRLEDDVWLDIIRWSGPVDPERLAAVACASAAAEVHALMADELGHDQGELVLSSGSAWAAAR